MENKGQISLILFTHDRYTSFSGVMKDGSVSNVLLPMHSVCALFFCAMKMPRNVEEKGVRKYPHCICSVERKIAMYSLMKAQRLRQEDTNLIFPPEKIAHTRKMMGPLQQEKLKEHRPVLTEQLGQRDIEVVRRSLEHLKTRNERIEALKLQVNAGTYQLDSTNVAQKMVGSSLARKILNTSGYARPAFNDEE